MWFAVLGGADFSLFLAGPTGAGKSELAALLQQHFGAGLDARHLPANWSSTGNALEALAFAAKDVLLVIDDFSPTDSSIDVQRYHSKADQVFRAQGNHAGRQRMRADSSLRPVKPPRSLILGTGEDIPKGHSLRARMFVVELSPTALQWECVSACQRDATQGLYVKAMAGFIGWLAKDFDENNKRIRTYIEQTRQALITELLQS